MENNFNKFNEIQHTPLRVFNRVAMLFNIKEDQGEETAKEYVNCFTESERKQMLMVMVAIEKQGVEAVRKAVTKDLVPTYDPNAEGMPA